MKTVKKQVERTHVCVCVSVAHVLLSKWQEYCMNWYGYRRPVTVVFMVR